LLVIDASAAVSAAFNIHGFSEFGGEKLVAPTLMWSEARSVLHEMKWRRVVTAADAEATRTRLEDAPVKVRKPRELGERAWRLADDFGWAKTYDAEYLALAQLLNCRLVTDDERLRRGADRLGIVISVNEL
jgi:predicted nucleic acid-binding protein